MPFADTIGASWAWGIPALSASAFVVIVVFGRFLPGKGSFVSIAAILLGFLLFWYVLRGLLAAGPSSMDLDWLRVGDTTITWGVFVDNLSVVMLGLGPAGANDSSWLVAYDKASGAVRGQVALPHGCQHNCAPEFRLG